MVLPSMAATTAIAHARAKFPAIQLEVARFEAWLADRCGGEPTESWLEDLYVACAVEHGDAAALAAFELAYLAPASAAVRAIDSSQSFVDEVLQRARERLLTAGSGRLAGLAQYAGRGPLAGFVRITVLRVALTLRRSERRREDHEHEVPALFPGADPELDYMRAMHRQGFDDALRVALAALSARERTLLRFHYFDRVPLTQLAVIERVHLATMSRRMAAIRRRVLGFTRRALADRFGEEVVSSLVRMLASRIEITLERFFTQDPQGPASGG
jgi:RNA polymerase sigma-70 factor (ECF subfamily)